VSEPQPGAMHPVDRAFYDLTVKQRNAAWEEVERLMEAVAELRRAAPDTGLFASTELGFALAKLYALAESPQMEGHEA